MIAYFFLKFLNDSSFQATVIFVSAVSILLVALTIYLALKDGKLKAIGGVDDLVGNYAKVIDITDEGYKVKIYDVIWNAESSEELSIGDRVKVKGYKEMVLQVSR